MLRIAYSDTYVLDLPEGHRFPMAKYALLIEQLLYEGSITKKNLFDPGLVEAEDVLRAHTVEYWDKLMRQSITPREVRKIGFPLSEKLIQRSRYSSAGTIRAAEAALTHGVAFNSAGGTHHAYADHGEAFCLLNDIAIASHWLLANGLARQILIVDLDVHQGNGTAKILATEPRAFTLSMHGKDNYPYLKEKSDRDIELPTGIQDEEYLSILRRELPMWIEQVKPDFVFYQAGVDILATDRLGHLGLTREGCKQRDEFVLRACQEQQIPVAVSMGGGYSKRLSDIVEAHCNTYRAALQIFDF